MTESLMGYNFAFLDENTKKEIRRSILKALAIPGYQVPFGSREMPIARGWGTGGMQITLSIIGQEDVVKVIDQGCDDSVNACNIRELVHTTTGARTTTDTLKATIIQTRHRIPEEKMEDNQILVFQVPQPEPLRRVEYRELRTREMHGEKDYSRLWVLLYENIVKYGEITLADRYPVMIHDRYIMDPSPIPRFDVTKLHQADTLFLFGAGREKRIYAIPPHTDAVPLAFDDYPFQKEDVSDKTCVHCGSNHSYMDEMYDHETGERYFSCSDTSYCIKRRNIQQGETVKMGGRWG